jgi:hypothetical protein
MRVRVETDGRTFVGPKIGRDADDKDAARA